MNKIKYLAHCIRRGRYGAIDKEEERLFWSQVNAFPWFTLTKSQENYSSLT